MSLTLYTLAALFLPLFPFSMAFNQGFARLRHPWLRAALLLAWPQLGVLLVAAAEGPIPGWLAGWALLTAALYAYRALALREVGLWVGFVATSAWALLWVGSAVPNLLHLQALGFSLPLALMALLTGFMESRFGTAHSGIGGRLGAGLATAAPRLAALFVVAVLAAVATPMFPNFFTLLATLIGQAGPAPLAALALVLVWLLWTWSGARLLQGIVVGPSPNTDVQDMSMTLTWVYSLGFVVLAVAGIALGGLLL